MEPYLFECLLDIIEWNIYRYICLHFLSIYSSDCWLGFELLYLCNFRTIGDLVGEAKASGNLGNTLKVLGNFEEAIVCCQRHLDISRELNDKVSDA